MTAGCDHQFVDSTSCIKCGWTPPLLNIVRVETEPPDYQADVIMGVGYFRMPSEEAMSDDPHPASAAWQDVLWVEVIGPHGKPVVMYHQRDVERARAADAQQIAALRAENHQLKRAISPSRAGTEPWDGMPSVDYFVGVCRRYREREPNVTTRSAEATEAQLTALQAEQAQWQPIDTAPKDMNPVLLFWPYWTHQAVIGEWEATTGYWSTEKWLGDDATDPGPTHWMPLPLTPKAHAALTAQQETPQP